MVLNTNISALTSINASTENNKGIGNSIEKLSSGTRINKSADDSSGLSIADNLRTQASSVSQSIDNANSAAKLLQLADKAMAEQSGILNSIKQKLIQAKTDTTSDEGRRMLGDEMKKLLEQLDKIAITTNYNRTYLLVGRDSDAHNLTYSDVTPTESLKFHIGEKEQDIVEGPDGVKATSDGLGIEGLYDIEITPESAGEYMEKIDDALDQLNEWRGDYGSMQNQVESSIRNMMKQQTNIKAAESVIRDTDYAQESVNFSQKNILSQSGNYALSQANKIQSNVFNLLR